MGSWPLAQPLFYQYRCTCEQADRLCCNGSAEISAIQDRLGSITIKRSNLITLDLLQSPAAQPREVLDRLPKHPNPSPLAWDSGGTAAAGEKPCLPTPTPAPERRAAAAGRCTPRRSRGTLKDGRCPPEPCGSVESCCIRPVLCLVQRQPVDVLHWTLAWAKAASTTSSPHQRL
jgi:hypothetical protein